MAFSNNKGGFTDINITPFVDVMLVLLIIFMVTTPMIKQSESIDLPKTDSSELLEREDEYITLSIDGLKKINIDGESVEFLNLEEYITKNSKLQEKKEVFFEADKDLPYGFVIKVISKVRNSGVEKINLITEPDK